MGDETSVQVRLAAAMDRVDRLLEDLDRAVTRIDEHAASRVVSDPEPRAAAEPERPPEPARAGWYWTLPAASVPADPAAASDLAEAAPRP